MKNKFHYPFLSLAAMAMTVGAANAAAIIYEPFSQNVGGLDGTSPGTGLTGTWTADAGVQVTAGSLSYGSPTALPTTGNKVAVASGNDASVAIGTALSSAGLLNNGSTLWFSFLLDPDNASSTNDNAGFAFGTRALTSGNGIPMLNSALDPGQGVGVSWDRGTRLHASQWNSGTRSVSATSNTISLTVTTLVVGSITWGALDTDNEVITIYLPGSSLTQPTALETYSAAAQTQSAFDTISFARKGETGETDLLDEIRFGASYADVLGVPEPTSALLGGLGALMLLRRRR